MALNWDVQRGWSAGAEVLAMWIRFLPFHFAFAVGGPGFEICVFIVGWRRELPGELPHPTQYLLLGCRYPTLLTDPQAVIVCCTMQVTLGWWG